MSSKKSRRTAHLVRRYILTDSFKFLTLHSVLRGSTNLSKDDFSLEWPKDYDTKFD